MGVVTKKGLDDPPKEDCGAGPKTGVDGDRDEEGDGLGYKGLEIEVEVLSLV